MAMIMCPECGTRISDRALTCSYCGYTADDASKPIAQQRSYEVVPRIQLELERWDSPNGSSRMEVTEVPRQDARRLVAFFSDWEQLQTAAPAVARLLRESFGEDQVKLVADLPEHVMKMIQDGRLRLVLDKSGEILPTVYGDKGAVKQVRLHWESIPPDVTGAFEHLETQASIALVLGEVKSLHEEMKVIRVGLQNDRLALTDGAWDKLMQARTIEDSRLRETMVQEAISSATDAKRMLMRNFTENLRYLQEHSNKGSFDPDAWKDAMSKKSSVCAVEAFQDLSSLTDAVRIEGEGYAILGQNDASQESLNEFREFIKDNKLDDRDTLLLINSHLHSDNKAPDIVDRFDDIAHRITALKEGKDLNGVPEQLLLPYQPDSKVTRVITPEGGKEGYDAAVS